MISPLDEAKNELRSTKSLTDLISVLKKAEGIGTSKVSIGISSNVVVEQAKYFFQKHGILNGFNCETVMGDYDNHIGNAESFSSKKLDCVIIHNLFDNISPLFEHSFVRYEASQVEGILSSFILTMRLSLQRLSDIKYVFVDKLYSIYNIQTSSHRLEVAEVIEKFNHELMNLVQEFKNVRLFDSAEILTLLGKAQALDLRYYYRYKAPFTTSFWDKFCEAIFVKTRNFSSFFYKVLVLDCDNTLWGGIIGEDLLAGVKLSPFDFPGNIFYQIQSQILHMQRHGVLICLCSKNNATDVDEVLQKHEYQLIKDDHVILKMVNWESKVENIKNIAETLNLGLDSFIFVDDSDFEIESVKSLLPTVKTMKVPSALHLYPTMMEEISDMFIGAGVTKESLEKTKQYKQMADAVKERQNAGSIEEYIKSLGLKVDIKLNHRDRASRIAELTQKSNQFNLTTKRYSEKRDLKLYGT